MTVAELKEQRNSAFTRANEILTRAESAKRPMTAIETADFDRHMREVHASDEQISASKPHTMTIQAAREQINAIRPTQETIHVSADTFGGKRETMLPKRLSSDYAVAFGEWLRNNKGSAVLASLQEATSVAGGYAVPVEVDGQIVPIAPTDCALRQLATVRETDRDILIPRFATFGTPLSSTVPEGSAFTEDDPTLDQITLSAFMIGSQRNVSFELLQDRKMFAEEIVDLDCAADQLMFEEQVYISGSGSGQAQGLIGNIGAGETVEPDSNGNAVCVDGALQVIASLKAAYLSNASWLMSRTTALTFRRSQVLGSKTAFENVWHRGADGVERFLTYPVFYSDQMPTAARSNTPAIFGDFRRGYVIGDRGGTPLQVKILWQMWAGTGPVPLIAFRRTDGRVRRAEALQGYTVSSS